MFTFVELCKKVPGNNRVLLFNLYIHAYTPLIIAVLRSVYGIFLCFLQANVSYFIVPGAHGAPAWGASVQGAALLQKTEPKNGGEAPENERREEKSRQPEQQG
ncbi:hypothetical protein [Pontibacter beigongshangensis]|uniref:hypothetical protein n=1 Tax=Pontibacter beigongshangensis TaxID=2574733 RepID=UPI00164FC0F4|nr:hypothetical protein [Pontibacter beigongshangensis]